jgi:hypothetical protein
MRTPGRVAASVSVRVMVAQRLELCLPLQQLVLQLGNGLDVGRLVQEAAQPFDACLGGVDPAAQVDHPLGDVVCGDVLVAQVADGAESLECVGEVLGEHLEHQDRLGLGTRRRALPVQEPSES